VFEFPAKLLVSMTRHQVTADLSRKRIKAVSRSIPVYATHIPAENRNMCLERH